MKTRSEGEEPRADQRRPLAGARGFFYGKSHLHLGADRQPTSLIRPQNHMAIHPRSGERALESALERAGHAGFFTSQDWHPSADKRFQFLSLH